MSDEYLKYVRAMMSVEVSFVVKVRVSVGADGVMRTTDRAEISREEVAAKVASLPASVAHFEVRTKHRKGHLRVKAHPGGFDTFDTIAYKKIVKLTPKTIECEDGSKYRRETCQRIGAYNAKAHPFDVANAEVLP